MAMSRKNGTHRLRYVTAKKSAHAETQLAYQLEPSSENGDYHGGRFRPRLIVPNATSEAGEPIFLLVDGKDCERFPSFKEDPEFGPKTAMAIANGKSQLAYELVASDETVDFHRVRSILRLEDLDRDFRNRPVFVFVDGKRKRQAGLFVPVDGDLGEISRRDRSASARGAN